MSVFSEKLVKHSRKVRRCVGCDNFATIGVGDPYWSCWYADGGDVGSYAMCVPCRDHLDECNECKAAWCDGDPSNTSECREETEETRE